MPRQIADDEGENGDDKDADWGSFEDRRSRRVDPLLPEKQEDFLFVLLGRFSTAKYNCGERA